MHILLPKFQNWNGGTYAQSREISCLRLNRILLFSRCQVFLNSNNCCNWPFWISCVDKCHKFAELSDVFMQGAVLLSSKQKQSYSLDFILSPWLLFWFTFFKKIDRYPKSVVKVLLFSILFWVIISGKMSNQSNKKIMCVACFSTPYIIRKSQRDIWKK